MKTRLFRSLALSGLLFVPALTIAQDPQPERPRYSAEELDNLVAPVALYADKLLAQVLVAATFPEQVAIAASFLRANGEQGIDAQDWDASVRAIAHYPPVLNMLSRDDDWATALGQAYATQPNDVLDAVQRLRRLAQEKGNLESTPEQNVTVQREYIYIEPANPEVIYVPTYDPYYVYAYPIYPYYRPHFSWGIGFPIGPWFGFGFDWYAGRIYYQGWHGYHWGPRWATVVGYYPAPRYRYIPPNPRVYWRQVNYARLDRDFRSVRRDVSFVRHSNSSWKGPDRVNGGGSYSGGDWDRSKGNGDRSKGGRPASFDDGRRDGDRNGGGSRYAESGTRPDFGKGDKPGGTRETTRPRDNGPTVFRGGSQPDAPDYKSTVRPTEGKTRSSNGPTVFRGSQPPTIGFGTTARPGEGKSRSNGPIVSRGSGSGSGSGGNVPTYTSTPNKSGKGGITYMTPRGSTPRTTSGGGQVVQQSQMRSSASVPRSASFGGVSRPGNSGSVRMSGGGGGARSAPARSSGGVSGANAKPSGGGSIPGGAVRMTGFGKARGQ